MKKNLRVITMICITLFILTISLKAQFTITGEFRPRAEYRNGYLVTGDSSMHGYTGILGRSRISFDLTQDKIATRLSLQHAYIFGENNFSSDTISKNTINIFEGWFRYSFTKNISLKVGRMALLYDDQRLIGVSNWKQWGATHDAVLIQTEINNYKADLAIAVNNMAPASVYLNAYTLKNYKYMAFLWQQKKFFRNALTISVTGILDVNQKPSFTYSKITSQTLFIVNGEDTIGTTLINSTSKVTENYPNSLYGRGTAGVYATYLGKNLSITASGYYQGGHYKDGRKINAYMMSGSISYQFLKWMKLGIGDDFLSGNDLSDTATYKKTLKGFSTLWGTNHSFYGYMDMFSGYIGRDALQYGLNSFYARGTFILSPVTSLELTYRNFMMPYGYLPSKAGSTNPYISTEKYLGSEIDLMITYKPLPNLEINGAYCVYIKTETREKLDGLKTGTGKTGQFAYLMVTYKPTFFNSDKK